MNTNTNDRTWNLVKAIWQAAEQSSIQTKQRQALEEMQADRFIDWLQDHPEAATGAARLQRCGFKPVNPTFSGFLFRRKGETVTLTADSKVFKEGRKV